MTSTSEGGAQNAKEEKGIKGGYVIVTSEERSGGPKKRKFLADVI